MFFLKEIKYFIIAIVLLVFVAVIGVVGVVYDNDGRDWLIGEAAKYVATQNGYKLEIEEINTAKIDNWQITKIVARKNGGYKIAADSIQIKWQFSNLLDGKVSVTKLSVLNVSINNKIVGNLTSAFDIENAWSGVFIDGSSEYKGNVDGMPLTVNLVGRGDVNNFSLDDLSLKTEQYGSMFITGSYQQKSMDFIIKASALPSNVISAAGWNVKPGKFTADLSIKGTVNKPLINGKLQFASQLSGKVQKMPLTVLSDISTNNGMLSIDTVFNKEKEKLGYVKVSLPIETYMNFNKVPADIPLKGEIVTDLDLVYLQIILDPDIHNIKGNLKADIKLNGSWKSPLIEGVVELKKGRYVNSKSGTVLNNINIKAKAENSRITIVNASARDGEDGKLTLSGMADWSNKLIAPVNFELKADKARILRRNDMEGVVSGSLALTGSFKELLLAGSLSVTPFTMTLDTLLTKDIPELKITEKYDGKPESNGAQPELSKFAPVINMDIVLIADNQAYLRGAGLDAELNGKIYIKGTLDDSQYSGSFKTVRGSYEVLGKKFTLQNGSVRFEGDTVSLLVPGVYVGKNAEIRAELSGTLEDLNLTLSSVPSMPQDEIVSNLLFGKSAQSISPLQAIKLANALRKLKGGGRELFNPVEAARKLIGVDNISVDSEQTENGQDVTVGVGKYVSEKVYIEVEKGSNPAQPLKGKIEAEILPNLNIESTTGENSGAGGVELQWKYDY